MEHRAFHYGVLGLIGAAHLGLLTLTPGHRSPLTPPQVLPVIEMVTLSAQRPAVASTQASRPQPRTVAPSKPVAPARPATAQARPSAVQVSHTSVAPNSNSVPQPLATAATAPANPAPTVTQAEPRAAVAEKPAASEQPYQAPTPVRGAQGNPKPEYPALSVELEEEGTVVLRVLVSEKGRALSVSVAKSSGYSRLDNAARRTVASQWQFTPGKRGGEVVEEYCLVPVEFIHPHKNKS